MASLDTIVLLIVDYHAAIWKGEDPRASLACALEGCIDDEHQVETAMRPTVFWQYLSRFVRI